MNGAAPDDPSPAAQLPVPDPVAEASLTAAAPSRQLSVVVPAYNESENMPELFAELAETFARHELDAQVVLVDDGSDDGTYEAAEKAAAEAGLSDVKLLRHRHNRGKTEALLSAAAAADGRYLVLFDADLQHATEEIPRFVDRLDDGFDVVTGNKVGRYEKRFVSRTYNWLARRIFKVPVRDLNAMKALRSAVLDDLQLRKDWHRYLVVLAHAEGYRIDEIDIQLHARRHGTSKYAGRGRILVGMLDLLAVWFQLVFSRKPMLFFGVTGLGLLTLGGLVGLVALYLRFVLEQGYRPLLTLVVLLVVVGLLLFVVGFLAELMASLRSEVEALRRELRGRRSE
jgi:glycosyltransferase involved in cell wall biosynthesis